MSDLDERDLANGENEAGQSGAGESGSPSGNGGTTGGSAGSAGSGGIAGGGTAGASSGASGSAGEAGGDVGGGAGIGMGGTSGTGGTGGSSGTGGTCTMGLFDCSGVCLDLSSDNANCGNCGTVCAPGSSCAGGECACIDPDMTLCGDGCVDTNSNAAHCGACGEACEGGRECVSGSCLCPEDLTECEGGCVDLTSNPEHCGTCGAACGAMDVCSTSECGADCGPGLTQCGQSCVDPSTNAAHCGECNEPCDSGQICAGSECTCPGGGNLCDGLCVSVSDENHCGVCDNACDGGRSCTAGECQCSTGNDFCNGQCRNRMTDPQHCGICNRACAADQTCQSGSCACASGLAACSGACANLSNDPANCGQCGTTCASGMCSGGTCAAGLVGYAAVDGLGVATTTGGGTAAVVRPANATELQNYASDATARVIEISGTFAVPALMLGSNKTLVGVGGATINGGIRIRNASNVIVRNLRVNAATTTTFDGIELYTSHHVWIDHVEIWDAPDGLLDVVHGSDYVTISWCKFWYSASPPADSLGYGTMIGHSDTNDAEDAGALKVTFHHNFWAERVTQRMPRVRYGKAHLFNNYYASTGNTNGINAALEGSVLIEYNVFNGILNPHYFNNPSDQATAYITARGNLYPSATGKMETGGGGTALTVPYAYTTDAAANVQQRVTEGAGPR